MMIIRIITQVLIIECLLKCISVIKPIVIVPLHGVNVINKVMATYVRIYKTNMKSHILSSTDQPSNDLCMSMISST